MSAAKLGRPTDNPRPHKISINDRSQQILETYCREQNVTKTEAIERGITLLATAKPV